MFSEIYGTDLLSAWLTLHTIARSALSAPVTIYGLDLLATSVTLNAIIRSAIGTPNLLINESANNELNALHRRQQMGIIIITGTLICGFFLPVIAVVGYIIVSILFFITPTISVARASLRKNS
jgi:hypothetical protein